MARLFAIERGGRGGAFRPGSLAALCLGAVVLAGCNGAGGLDWDLRRRGLSTAEAARGVTAQRPPADARGVITYPGYQVAIAQRGESLRQMAARLGVDAGELARQNALAADTVLQGGELVILPGGGAAPAPAGITATPLAPVPAEPAGPEPRRHTVQRGETVFSIARLYNLPARTIAEWNGLPADMSVREGQVLLIPVPQPISQAAAAAPLPVTPPGTPSAARPAAPPPVAPAATTSAPGQGTPTPPPPSAATPLPATNPAPAGQGATAAAPPRPVADMAAQRTEGPRLAMPVQGRVIRAYQRGRNDGIGIGAPAGTEVRAAAAGTVAAITRDTDQVPILVIRHENNLLTVYANIDNIRVERGARVTRGQPIAVVRRGDPPFLHFEVREGYDSVDPMPYLQ